MAAPSSRSSSHRALRARDAGLRRISLTTRALVVGSVAATGAFTSLAAWAQPGRSKAVAAASPGLGGQFRGGARLRPGGTTPATTPATTQAPASGGGDDDLAPPTAAPATVPAPAAPAPAPAPAYQYTPPTPQYSPPVVVSGAS